MTYREKIGITVVLYLLAFYVVYLAVKVDPTTLAGPGLDIVVFPLVYIWSLILVIKYSIKIYRNFSQFKWMFLIHLIGFIMLIIFLVAINDRPFF
jgi:hypothetical protein